MSDPKNKFLINDVMERYSGQTPTFISNVPVETKNNESRPTSSSQRKSADRNVAGKNIMEISKCNDRALNAEKQQNTDPFKSNAAIVSTNKNYTAKLVANVEMASSKAAPSSIKNPNFGIVGFDNSAHSRTTTSSNQPSDLIIEKQNAEVKPQKFVTNTSAPDPRYDPATASVLQQHRNVGIGNNTSSTVQRGLHPGGREPIINIPVRDNGKFQNHSSSLNAVNKLSKGHLQNSSKSVADGHHKVATNTSTQRLKMKAKDSGRELHHDIKKGKSQPDAIEILDDKNLKLEQLIQHYTVAIANQVGRPDNRNIVIANAPNSDFHFYPNGATNNSERKRSLPDSSDHGAQKRSAIQRQSVPYAEAQTTMFSIPSGSSHSNRSGSGPNRQNSSYRESNVNDAMNKALDETIDISSHETISTSGRPVDTPMTHLVRQLLGQVEIRGDEPTVMLTPRLVKEASQKIVLVINKVIELLVMKANSSSQTQLREAENRLRSVEELLNAKNRDNIAANFASQQKNLNVLKTFAEEKCGQLAESNKTIANLRLKLANYEQQSAQNAATKYDMTANCENNSTMRRLITQLDESMSTIQIQKTEIEALRAIIEKDASSLQRKREMKSFLQDTFQLFDLQSEQQTNAANKAIEDQQIVSLINEVKALQAALSAERQQNENTLKAYMKAAVHALKIQRKEEMTE